MKTILEKNNLNKCFMTLNHPLSPRALLSKIENLKDNITNRQTKDYSGTSYFLNENEHDIDSMDNNSFIYL